MVQHPKSPPSPGARSLALDILAGSARRGRWVEDLLADALARHPHLPRRERALLLELVQGVKRWELRLDYVLSQVSDLPLQKLHPLVLQILRLGAFQLLMLDRVPPRAALHESGQLARARRLPRAHLGFINAVLRRLASGEPPPLPPIEGDPVRALSIAQAHPAWLVQRWLARYGREEAAARLAANNRIPPLTIRINTFKTDIPTLQARLAREGVESKPCRFSPVGLELVSVHAAPMGLPSYREGWWLFQDEAAQLVTHLLPVAPGQRVLEMGAGRGGKTSHLAEAMAHRGLLLAVDVHSRRLKELQRHLGRWGVTIAQPLLADATAPLPLKSAAMDAVLMDVPCSGLGTIRRHPEIKTRLQEEDLAGFPPRQRAMLAAAAALVRPAGCILYITCTTEPEENEEVINSFLAAHSDYRLATDPALLPVPARALVQPSGFFRTSPAEHNLDAFFAALLARE